MLVCTELLKSLKRALCGYAASIRGLVLFMTEKAVTYALPERIEPGIAITVVNFFLNKVGSGLRFSFFVLSDGFDVVLLLFDGFLGLFLFVFISTGY